MSRGKHSHRRRQAPSPASGKPRRSREGTESDPGPRKSESTSAERGRSARTPSEIPKPGWRDILISVWRELGTDHATLVASGLALYALLAVFPALAAMISLYGLFASPLDVLEHMRIFAGVLPADAWEIFNTQLQEIAGRERGTLSAGAALGMLVALWSARSGMVALISVTNIAYKEQENRRFFVQILISLGFTVAAIAAFLMMLLLGVAVPLALEVFGASPWVQWTGAALRWVLLWLLAVLGLAFIYRYAPDRERAQWRWVTWGSAIAATLWLLSSILFALYVRSFGTYGKTYGALGGVIVLLMWFYLSSLIVVIGAKINAEMEHQTSKDTTEGPEAPMGQRGAYVADTVGESP